MSQVVEQVFGRLKSNQIAIATDGDAWLLQLKRQRPDHLHH
jgi:hypothetical protein